MVTEIVTTRCPNCGEVEIPLGSVVMRVCDEDQSATLSCRCPQCAGRFVRPLVDGEALLLAMFDVAVTCWSLPSELGERPSGLDPITAEDADRFADLLDGAENVVELLAP